MRNVIGLDPGLATFGSVIMASDGMNRHIRAVEFFESSGGRDIANWRICDDLTRRTRELAKFLREFVSRWRPVAAFSEYLPVFNEVKPQTFVSLSWGVIVTVLESFSIPLTSVAPNTWRKAVCGIANEERAHQVAMMENPQFHKLETPIPQGNRAHCRDALGVLAWADRAGLIKNAVLR